MSAWLDSLPHIEDAVRSDGELYLASLQLGDGPITLEQASLVSALHDGPPGRLRADVVPLPRPSQLVQVTDRLAVALALTAELGEAPLPVGELLYGETLPLVERLPPTPTLDWVGRRLKAMLPLGGAPFTAGGERRMISLQLVSTEEVGGDIGVTLRLVGWTVEGDARRVSAIKEEAGVLLPADLCGQPTLRVLCWLLGWRDVLMDALSGVTAEVAMPMDVLGVRHHPLRLARPQTPSGFAAALRARKRLGWLLR